MFIEVTAYNGKTLVNTSLITYVERSTDDEYTILWFTDGNDCVRCNETYNEIVWKIAEGERVVTEEERKD